MNFLKKLFAPRPEPEQKELNLGWLKCVLELNDGRKFEFEFEGEYRFSYDLELFNKPNWIDYYDTALDKFADWKKSRWEIGDFKIGETQFISAHHVKEIRILEQKDRFVTTDRKHGN